MHNNGGRGGGGGSFATGLLWGFLLGAAFVFFIGTKKGRKLFKVLMDEGIEGVSEVSSIIDSMTEEPLDDASSAEKPREKITKPIHAVVTPARRFFKGVRRSTSN